MRVLSFSHVNVTRGETNILSNFSWEVTSDQRWIVLGPNGSGKTTILEIASAWETPSSGTVEILGEDLATADPEWLRPQVGLASSAMAKRIPFSESVSDSVVSAAYAAAERMGRTFEDIDVRRAGRVLGEWGLEQLSSHAIGSLSEGELKRLQIARSIMTDPELLLLDEPATGLDLGSREELMQMLGGFASNPKSPAIVMVTHQVEEIPAGFTHALILSNGVISSAGPIEHTLTSENMKKAYGVDIVVEKTGPRFSARVQL